VLEVVCFQSHVVCVCGKFRKRREENVPWSLRSYLDGLCVGSAGESLSLGAASRRSVEIFD